MANPFLVLGGIAVGIITASFGVLQVPGWVESAQDAAAKNDLANIRAAEATAVSTTGKYGANLTDLGSGAYGLEFGMSGGVNLTGIAVSDTDWCAAAQSASGKHLAVSSTTTGFGEGATVAAALASAGCPADLAGQIGSGNPGGGDGDGVGQAAAAFTLTCPTTMQVGLPIAGATGTVTWSDGVEAEVADTVPLREVTGGQTYTVTFDGTFTTLSVWHPETWDENVPWDALECFTSMDAWSESAGTINAESAFEGMTSLTSVPANLPSTVRSTQYMFSEASSFNDPAIIEWDMAGVLSTGGMFMRASAFNQPIGNWEMSGVGDTMGMFSNASSFNQPLADWDVSNVTNMSGMFRNAAAFNQDLSGWNVAASASAASHSFFADGSGLQPSFYPVW